MNTKNTKWPQNLQSDQKIYQTAAKFTKRPKNINRMAVKY
jgi:hypothetical protein